MCRGEPEATRSTCLHRLQRITNACQQQLECCHLFTKGARRLLNAVNDQLTELYVQQGEVGLEDFCISKWLDMICQIFALVYLMKNAYKIHLSYISLISIMISSCLYMYYQVRIICDMNALIHIF